MLYLSQKSPCINIQLQSALTAVGDNGFCKIGVGHISCLPVKLKPGVLLGIFLPFLENIEVLNDFLISQINHVSTTPDNFQVFPITEKHLSDLNSPHYETDLLALLNSYKNVVSLQKEALGHISIIQHAIHLILGSKPYYIYSELSSATRPPSFTRNSCPGYVRRGYHRTSMLTLQFPCATHSKETR